MSYNTDASQLLIDQLPVSIFSVDRQYCYTAFNGHHADIMRRLYGTEPKVRQNMLECVTNPAHKAQMQQCFDRALGGETVEELMHPDGNVVYELDFFSNRDNSGEITGVSVTSRDVTEYKQAEIDLRQSEEKYRRFVNQSNQAFTLTDEQGIIIEWNQAAEALTRIPAVEARGHHTWDIQHRMLPPKQQTPQMLELIRQRIELVLKTGTGPLVGTFEAEVPYPDGTRSFFRQTLFSIKTTSGFQIGTISHDITATKLAEQALRESEERFRSVMTSMTEGVVVQMANGEIVFCNPSAETILGLTADQLRGRTSVDPRWRSVHEDGSPFPGETHPAMVTLRTGEPCTNVIMGIDLPDGSLRWISINSQPIYLNNHPRPTAAVATFVDITDRRRAQESLQKANARYYALFDQANDAVFILDMDGRHVEANSRACLLLGYDKEEILGLSFSEISAELPESQKVLESLRQHRYVAPYERLFRKKSGDVVPVEINVEVVLDAQGQPLHIQSVVRDITERKQAQAALQAAKDELEHRVQERTAELQASNTALQNALRAKDEFMSAMSHEFRTPLTSILGLTEVLDETHYGALTEKQHRALKIIERNGQRLLTLVNNVLDYSQLQSGVLTPHLSLCDAGELCRSVLHEMEPFIAEKKQQLHFSMTAGQVRVRTDPQLTQKILLHLLDNASKFTAVGGEIGISVEDSMERQQVAITVWDTGIGIRQEDLPRLFQPMVQLDASLARQYEGAGLGLTLVKGMTELLGGTIDVQSALGRGSRFTINLPRE